MTYWRYNQSTGEFDLPGGITFQGYAGKGHYRNDPDSQSMRGLGPLPVGDYVVSVRADPKPTPFTLRLAAVQGSQTFGRSGFLIHGDNAAGNASSGCIILNRPAREFLCSVLTRQKNPTMILTVISGKNPPHTPA